MRLLWFRLFFVGAFFILLPHSYAQPTCDVSSIQPLAPKNATITAASMQTSGSSTYCQMTGSISSNKAKGDEIEFQIALPPAWNNRMVFLGNGVFGGQLPSSIGDGYMDALAQNYAVVTTDTGHQTSALADAAWALNNLPAVKDFEYRAVHKTTVAAQSLINAYYGSPIQFSHFQGCSTGGRQGIVQAEKYPADFDGVIAGDPAIGDPFLAGCGKRRVPTG